MSDRIFRPQPLYQQSSTSIAGIVQCGAALRVQGRSLVRSFKEHKSKVWHKDAPWLISLILNLSVWSDWVEPKCFLYRIVWVWLVIVIMVQIPAWHSQRWNRVKWWFVSVKHHTFQFNSTLFNAGIFYESLKGNSNAAVSVITREMSLLQIDVKWIE